MEAIPQEAIVNLDAIDDEVRFSALETILRLTEAPVAWADEVWDEMVAKLADCNSYQRSIGIMVLCNLAKSVADERASATLPLLLAHTRDERLTTSRQCIQNLWKVAVAHPSLAPAILDHLEDRFLGCAQEAHYNLLRRDVIQSMRAYQDAVGEGHAGDRARSLIDEEPSASYRKQYRKVLASE